MILHLDADCFFASCEMMRDPSLRSKPVAVGGRGASICIAKNYIAKAYGIKTGTPRWEAEKMCPNLVFLPVDFALYGKVSKKMMALAGQFSDLVEVTSVDECFLDLSIHNSEGNKTFSPIRGDGAEKKKEGELKPESKSEKRRPKKCDRGVGGKSKRSYEFYTNLANNVRTTIGAQLGITISVGIGETKTIAKIASDINKPNGIKIVMPSDRESFLKSVPIQDVPGIGTRQTPKMLLRGIKTMYDYIQFDLPTIRTLYHRPGINHWWEFQGRQMLPVNPEHKAPKSIIRTRSFDSPITNLTRVWNSYVEHTQRVLVKLQQEQLTARRIFLYIREADHQTHSYELKMETHTAFYPKLIAAVKMLYTRFAKPSIIYRSTGVGVHDLHPLQHYQYSLFEGVTERPEKLESAIQFINNKWGQTTIRRGVKT